MDTPTPPSKGQRIAVGMLSILAVGASLYALAVLPGPPGQPTHLRILRAASWNIGYGVLAMLIAWRGGPDRGVLLAGWFLSLMATQSALRVLGVTPDVGSPLVIGFISLGAVTYGVGIRFTQSFPIHLTPNHLRRLQGPISRFVSRPAGLLLPWPWLWIAVLIAEVVQHGLFPDASVVWHVLFYAGLASFYLAAGLRLGDPGERRRVFWILEGVLIYLILEGLWTAVFVGRNVLGLAFGMASFTQWLTAVEGATTLLCFAIAIFFYGAFDSGLVVRRTIILGVLSGLALVLVVALEEVLAGVVARTTGIDAGVGAVLGGVVAALAFRPVSARLDGFLKARVDAGTGGAQVGLE